MFNVNHKSIFNKNILLNETDLEFITNKIIMDGGFLKTRRLGLINDVFVFNISGSPYKSIEFYDLSKDIALDMNIKDSRIPIEDIKGPIDKRSHTQIKKLVLDMQSNYGLIQPTEEIMTIFFKSLKSYVMKAIDGLIIGETEMIYLFSKLTGLSGKYWLKKHKANSGHFIDFGGLYFCFGKSSTRYGSREKLFLINYKTNDIEVL